MDLNLHLYLFTDRELNDIILCDFKLVDTCIYNMNLFFQIILLFQRWYCMHGKGIQ